MPDFHNNDVRSISIISVSGQLLEVRRKSRTCADERSTEVSSKPESMYVSQITREHYDRGPHRLVNLVG